jgi:hypothetical protein
MNKDYPVRPERLDIIANQYVDNGNNLNCSCDNAAYLSDIYSEIKRRRCK